jgi:hypothetical protein
MIATGMLIGQAARDPKEDGHRLAPLVQRERRDDDRDGGGEQQRSGGALEHPERDDPRLGDRARRGEATAGRCHSKADHADHHHPTPPEHVAELATEGEQRRQRQQIPVDDPLRAGRRQRQVLLQVRDRDRHDRLIDERHRDREHHRRQHQALVRHAAVHAACPKRCHPAIILPLSRM